MEWNNKLYYDCDVGKQTAGFQREFENTRNIRWPFFFKATARKFHFLLIMAAPVDKSGRASSFLRLQDSSIQRQHSALKTSFIFMAYPTAVSQQQADDRH